MQMLLVTNGEGRKPHNKDKQCFITSPTRVVVGAQVRRQLANGDLVEVEMPEPVLIPEAAPVNLNNLEDHSKMDELDDSCLNLDNEPEQDEEPEPECQAEPKQTKQKNGKRK